MTTKFGWCLEAPHHTKERATCRKQLVVVDEHGVATKTITCSCPCHQKEETS